MKKQFAEYYDLPNERIKEIWENSLIVLDTNVLLNLYRYNEDARTEFINALKLYEGRLWIPYQVGLEFHRRRENIMRKNAEAYETLGNSISAQLVKAVDILSNEYARHPYIDMKDIRKKVDRCATSIRKSLEAQGKKHPDYFEKDDILDAVSNLFDGCVGNDFTEVELEALYKEGERRYANQVPPGYCDEKNKKDKAKRSLYGDLVVWKQVIAYAKEKEQCVILITDDHKSDWWDKVEGKHSPRKELIREFMDCTGHSILIYDSGRFLEYVKKNKELKVSQKTINEVGKIRELDLSIMDFMNAFSQAGANHMSDRRHLYTIDFLRDDSQKETIDNFWGNFGDVQPDYDASNWYDPNYPQNIGHWYMNSLQRLMHPNESSAITPITNNTNK